MDVYPAVCTVARLHFISRGAGIWELDDAIYLKYDENINASQDDSCDGHLCLHVDVERLVGHGEGHHLIILEEGLDCDDDGLTVSEKKTTQSKITYL